MTRGALAAITLTAVCGAFSCSRCDDSAARPDKDAATSDAAPGLAPIPSTSTSAADPERDASLAVTDADLATIPDAEICEASVTQTWVRGELASTTAG